MYEQVYAEDGELAMQWLMVKGTFLLRVDYFLSVSMLSDIFALTIARIYEPFIRRFNDACVLSGRRNFFYGLFLSLRFWCLLVISLSSSFIRHIYIYGFSL
jgi:hypothetical protein